MASDSDIRRIAAESGQQSLLDQLERAGGFTNVRRAFEAGQFERKPRAAADIARESLAGREAKRGELFGQFRGEEEEFLGRFRTEFPTILTGIEEQLGLPALRKTAFEGLESFQDIPEVQETAARGRDISANQLARIIAAEQEERLPGVEGLLGKAQFAEEEFGRKAERELVPFETEIGFMKDRFSREATGFNLDAENELNLLLTQIQTEGAANVATINKAAKLAELEEKKRQFEESIWEIDLGDRVAIMDAQGNEIGSKAKGKLAGGAGLTDADIDAELGTLQPVSFSGQSPLPPGSF